MKKIALVTGGHGFLGRAAARVFKMAGYRVVGIGHGRWTSEEAEAHGFDTWLDAGVTLSSLLTVNEQFNVVVHCAGNGSVGYSISNPLQDFKKTVETTAELLEYVRMKIPAAKIVYPSSAGIYGAKPDVALKTSEFPNPVSPYGYSKLMSEKFCESYSRIFGLSITIIRYFSIYGPGLTKQLLWDAANKFVLSNKEVIFWGTGNETRDWIFIDDAAHLMVSSVENPLPRNLNFINGGSGLRVTVKEVLELLRNALGVEYPIKFNGQTREGDPQYYWADISEALMCNWTAKTPLQNGIRKFASWFREVRIP